MGGAVSPLLQYAVMAWCSGSTGTTLPFYLLWFLVWCEVLHVSPKVSGLAVWNENFKWYSSLPLGAVVSLFCQSFCRHNTVASQ
jgi:hypothetical protein